MEIDDSPVNTTYLAFKSRHCCLPRVQLVVGHMTFVDVCDGLQFYLRAGLMTYKYNQFEMSRIVILNSVIAIHMNVHRYVH